MFWRQPIMHVLVCTSICSERERERSIEWLKIHVSLVFFFFFVFLTFGQANFARAVASLSKAQAKKVTRFLPNPERHWGPKLRAGRKITSKHISLLGPQALNGTVDHEDEEPIAKRQKAQEPSTNSWFWGISWKYVSGSNLPGPWSTPIILLFWKKKKKIVCFLFSF